MASEAVTENCNDQSECERGGGHGRPKGVSGGGVNCRGRSASLGRGKGRGKRKKTGAFVMTEEEGDSMMQQKECIKKKCKDLVEGLSEQEAKDILCEAAETIPTLILNVREKLNKKSVPSEPGPSESRPGYPDWCVCTHCRDTLPEDPKICCNYRPELCQSTIPEMHLITDINVLTVQRLYRNDVFARHNATNCQHNKAMRHAAYRQYILFEYGRLGRGNRRPVPLCVTWYIRDKFPDPNGNYVPYVPSW